MSGFSIGTGDGPSAKNPNKGDWLREHRFLLRSLFGTEFNKGDILSVRDIKMPEKDIKELAIQTPGTTYKFASQVNYTDLEITFYSTKKNCEELLIGQSLVHSLGSGLSSYDEYKKTVEIDMFWGSDRNSANAVKYKFKGAWPSRVYHSQLSYTSSAIMSISMTIKYDFFEVETPTSVMFNDNLLG